MRTFRQFLKSVGGNIKRVRMRLGWTQVEASRKSRIPERRYQEMEAGKANITLRSLFRIARAFNQTPSDILKDIKRAA